MPMRRWSHRHLVLALALREYQVRYRQSLMGLLWAFVVPIATLGAGTLVFKHVAGVRTDSGSYELMTLAGIVPWTFFASAVSFGIGSVVAQRTMVTKLAFPRYALPVSMIGVSLLDFVISGLIFSTILVITGEGFKLTALWVPLLLTIEIAFVLGIVLLGSAANVFARDIRLGVPLLIQLWLLLTPVMYPISAVPAAMQDFYILNPMTGLVDSFRRVLLDGRPPDFGLLLPAVVGATFALLVGSWYFAATQRRFADVI
jgi:lipopolysaccharide transport system permease protein